MFVEDMVMPRHKSLLRTLAEPLLVAVVLAFAVRAAVRIYSIPSESMAPTLQVGDHIAVTPYVTDTPARGDVIVFRSPADGAIAVKRIAGLPGDLMESKSGRVVVPAGCYFVIGDNRAVSHDSRQWGPLPGHMVLGRARLVLWGGAPVSSPARASDGGGAPSNPGTLRLRRIFKWIE